MLKTISLFVVLSACALTPTDDVEQALGGAPTFQAAGPAASGTSGVFVSWPAEQTNDVGLLVVETANEAVVAPAGWLAVANSPQSTSDTRLSVFWRRAISSSEPHVAVFDPGDHVIAQILTFRGCTTSGFPWDVTAGYAAATASSSVTWPFVTTSVDNTLIVAVVSDGTDATLGQLATASSLTLPDIAIRSTSNTTAGNGGGVSVATGTLSAAGSSGLTFGLLRTASTQGLMTIALKP